jgi:hypothetical protein
MRRKVAALLAAAFALALLASPAPAKHKPSPDGRSGSTIIAARE